MLAVTWQVDIQELFEAFVNEPGEIKRNLYDSLDNYILQKSKKILVIAQVPSSSPLKLTEGFLLLLWYKYI